jgi:uncharacterized protein (AIM24 family)
MGNAPTGRHDYSKEVGLRAEFEVIHQEGVRLVKATLKNEAIRTESGALYYMRGDVTMESKAPSASGFLKARATGEKVFRPTYTDTGEVYLEPSFGNFHVFELGASEWIIERGGALHKKSIFRAVELPAWLRRGGRDQRNAAEPPR